MAEKDQTNRWRCTVTGCNPKLASQEEADAHRGVFGHRVAKWPVRSAEGKRRAKKRNPTGYYDRYNVGAKAPVRSLGGGWNRNGFFEADDHPFSPEALGQG